MTTENENENGIGEEATGFTFDTEFDVAEEYRIPPIIPSGSYEGYITSIKPDKDKCALVWGVTLKADDDVMMSDGETPVNGNVLTYTNWFPKAGDETQRTKNGKTTKRLAKINMINDFQKGMRINMNDGATIMEAINNAEWIGLEVIATVEVRTYEGRTSNQIKSMVAA